MQIEGFPEEGQPLPIAIVGRREEGESLHTHYYTPQGFDRFLKKQVIQLTDSNHPDAKPPWKRAFILFGPTAFETQKGKHRENLANGLPLALQMLDVALEAQSDLVATMLTFQTTHCKRPGESCKVDSLAIVRNPAKNSTESNPYNNIALLFHFIGSDEIHIQTGVGSSDMIPNPEQNAVKIFEGANTRAMIVRGDQARQIYQKLQQKGMPYTIYP